MREGGKRGGEGLLLSLPWVYWLGGGASFLLYTLACPESSFSRWVSLSIDTDDRWRPRVSKNTRLGLNVIII